MATLLHIDSSPRAASVSSRLAAVFVAKWQQQNPAGTVVDRNTSLDGIPYLDEAAIDAFFTPPAELTLCFLRPGLEYHFVWDAAAWQRVVEMVNAALP